MVVHSGFDSEGDRMTENVELPVWRTPDFVEYDTPMEITGYVARMD
jgi:coenzyme PQQ precursor peptide PqqA